MLANAKTCFGDVTWDEDTRSMLHSDSDPVHLTCQQANVFQVLLGAQGRTVTRRHLVDVLWDGRDDGPEDKTLDVIICRIRRGLTVMGSETRIEVERAVGFRLQFEGDGDEFVTCRMTRQEYKAVAPTLARLRAE